MKKKGRSERRRKQLPADFNTTRLWKLKGEALEVCRYVNLEETMELSEDILRIIIIIIIIITIIIKTEKWEHLASSGRFR